MRFLRQLGDWLTKFFMVAIIVITVLAVFMRYVLNNPLQWVEEVLIALYIWAIMLGAASAMKNRGHVSIDAFVTLLPARARRWVQRFNDVVSIIVLATFGWLGLQLALLAGDKITPILGIKYMYLDLAVPVGAFWMVIYLVAHLLADANKTAEGGN